MATSEAVAEAETDPHRRDVPLNYNRQAALEFSDLWQHIFTPEMTVAEPKYRVQLGTCAPTRTSPACSACTGSSHRPRRSAPA
jgi:hypothetical protein